MTDSDDQGGHHPSTYKAVRTQDDGIAWDDHATIHEVDDGQGVLDAMKALHRGTLAEMVARISGMPVEDRGRYVIQKAGDHRLDPPEIEALARREDFPLKR